MMPLFIFVTAAPASLPFGREWAVLGITNTQNKTGVLAENLSSKYGRGATDDAGKRYREIT